MGIPEKCGLEGHEGLVTLCAACERADRKRLDAARLQIDALRKGEQKIAENVNSWVERYAELERRYQVALDKQEETNRLNQELQKLLDCHKCGRHIERPALVVRCQGCMGAFVKATIDVALAESGSEGDGIDAQAQLCFERILDLQIRLAQIVSKLCEEAMMSPEVRKRLIFDVSVISESLERTRAAILMR